MKDLFGNEVEEPDEYTRYLASAAWARKREAKLHAVGYRCQRCGVSRHTRPLNVHHLNYDRLGHENMDDLEVVCVQCHPDADLQRIEVAEIERRDQKYFGALAQGFKNWLERGHHKLERMGEREAFREKQLFLYWMHRKSGIAYTLDLNIFGIDDPDPNWKAE